MRKVIKKAKSTVFPGILAFAVLLGVVSMLLGRLPWDRTPAFAGGGDWINYGTSFGERQPQSGSYRVGETVTAGWNALKPASQMESEAQPGNVEITINRITNIFGTDVSAGQAGFSDADAGRYVQAGAPNGGYAHGFARTTAVTAGDTNSSNWQLTFSWVATTPGYYQIDITPRANQSRSLGWVAIRVDGQGQQTSCPLPNAPTGLTPNGQTFPQGTRSVTLSWNGVPGAASYWVGVKTPGGVIIFQNENFVGTSVTVSGLVDGQSFDWFVIARSSCGLGQPATASFSIAGQPAQQQPPAQAVPAPVGGPGAQAVVPRCVSLVPNTSRIVIGDTLDLRANVTTNENLNRIEVFFFNPANRSPDSEFGWTHLGTVVSSGQQVTWNTSQATPGNHTLTMVVWDNTGTRTDHWRTNAACTATVEFVRPQAAAAAPAPTATAAPTAAPTQAPAQTQTQTQTQTVNITQAAAAQPQVLGAAAPRVLPKTGPDVLWAAPVLLGLAVLGRKIRKNFKLV